MLAGYVLAVVKDPSQLLQEVKPPPDILVVAGSSIQGAIQAASYVIPAVVLTEHNFPDGQGLDLVLALKNHPRLRHVPIIVLGMDDLLYYQWLGITRYLPSHREPGQINRVLEEVLSGQVSRQLTHA